MAGFNFYIKEGFSGFARNRSATISAIAITTLILFIMSLFLMMMYNINQIIKEVKSGLYIYVYIKESYEDTELIKERIYEIDGIQTIDFISKEDAEEEFRETFKDDADMLDVLDKNYFPSSYRITVDEEMRDEDTITTVADTIGEIEGIDEVDFGQDWVERITYFEGILELLSIVIGIILILINIIIVSNAIKLIILRRTEKITLSRLVGGTDTFIRTPFIIEGFVIGLMSGIIALTLLYVIIAVFSGYNIMDLEYLPLHYSLGLIVGGALLGIVASFFSTSSYLKKLR